MLPYLIYANRSNKCNELVNLIYHIYHLLFQMYPSGTNNDIRQKGVKCLHSKLALCTTKDKLMCKGEN